MSDMGYSHYYSYPAEGFPADRWQRFISATKGLFEVFADDGSPKLAGGLGSGDPKVDDTEVWFNGSKERGEDYETFYLRRVPTEDRKSWADNHGRLSDSVKTSREPYDLAVMVVLLLAKRYLLTVKVYTDGTDADWERAFELLGIVDGGGEDYHVDDDGEVKLRKLTRYEQQLLIAEGEW